MDVTMGNQQERSLESNLSWFAGVFDGEGCISIVLNNTVLQLQPRIRLTNTSSLLIEEAMTVLDSIDIPYKVRRSDSKKKVIGKRTVFSIDIFGVARIKKFLEQVGPYLRAKKMDAQLALNFVNSRLTNPQNNPYTTEEIEYFLSLREFHGYKLKKSSESIRRALYKHRDDVLRSASERRRRRQK